MFNTRWLFMFWVDTFHASVWYIGRASTPSGCHKLGRRYSTYIILGSMLRFWSDRFWWDKGAVLQWTSWSKSFGCSDALPVEGFATVFSSYLSRIASSSKVHEVQRDTSKLSSLFAHPNPTLKPRAGSCNIINLMNEKNGRPIFPAFPHDFPPNFHGSG